MVVSKIKKIINVDVLIPLGVGLLAFLLRVPFFIEPPDFDEGNYAFFAFFSKGEKFYSPLPIGRLPGMIFT